MSGWGSLCDLALACLSGRVERMFDTLPDRLVQELRLAGIPSIEAANSWLPKFIAPTMRAGRRL